MRYIIGVIAITTIVTGIIIAAVKARRANKEESALTMHPDNFKKPGIEQVEKLNQQTKNEDNTTGLREH